MKIVARVFVLPPCLPVFPALLALVLVGGGCASVAPSGPVSAVDLSLGRAERALGVAVNPAAPAEARAKALRAYNRAVAEAVVALAKPHPPVAGRYRVTLAAPAGMDRFVTADRIGRNHLELDVRRAGFGGALVGVMDGPESAGPNRPPKGYAIPWTAVAEFGPAAAGRTPVKIRLLDPRLEDHVRLAGAERPLAGDFTAPIAFYPHPNELVFGALAMLRSDRSVARSGLWFYEPYDPRKIPVLFVHGLMSSPHAFLQVANELNADPEFRRRYQIWSYFYPTGAPIAANAMALRKALAALPARYPGLRPNIVMIGHSMGGILTRMQVTNARRTLWDAVFKDKADAVYARLPANSPFKEALLFQANPYVARVVFIATPHRGSQLATLRISALAAKLIRLPVTLVNQFKSHVASVLREVDPSIRSLPTSIQGLSPGSPLLLGVDRLEMTAPCHSIIGNRGRDREPLAESSDGVVPYWSSHLDRAESEIIVPTGHDAFDHPRSVAELRRILAL